MTRGRYRAATQVAGGSSWALNAAVTVVVAQTHADADPGRVAVDRARPTSSIRTLRAWRVSLFAGFMGAAASIAWFTAFAIQSVTYVRTLGLTEMLFSYVVSRRIFREQLTPSRAVRDGC